MKAELRRNLIAKIRAGETLFPGIVGYDETVLPQVTNAILGGQDIILLGERGQAKSRIVRGLTSLLDEFTPIIDGAEIPENPFAPITAHAPPGGRARPTTRRSLVERSERYGRKLGPTTSPSRTLDREVGPHFKSGGRRYLSESWFDQFRRASRVNRGIFAP